MNAAAAAMDDVVRRLAPALGKRGFKKQRRAFAREVAPDVVQAILFQMGRFEPAEDRRPGYHGSFTVELGVWLGELARIFDEERPKFVRPYDCHVRQRLGFLTDEPEDTWWTLDQSTEEIADAMVEAFDELALPWLDSLATLQGVLAAAAATDPMLDDLLRTTSVLPALHYVVGDREAATAHVKRELRRTGHRGAAEHLVNWARGLGLDVSMEDAAVVRMLERERAEWEAGRSA